MSGKSRLEGETGLSLLEPGLVWPGCEMGEGGRSMLEGKHSLSFSRRGGAVGRRRKRKTKGQRTGTGTGTGREEKRMHWE